MTEDTGPCNLVTCGCFYGEELGVGAQLRPAHKCWSQHRVSSASSTFRCRRRGFQLLDRLQVSAAGIPFHPGKSWEVLMDTTRNRQKIVKILFYAPTEACLHPEAISPLYNANGLGGQCASVENPGCKEEWRMGVSRGLAKSDGTLVVARIDTGT